MKLLQQEAMLLKYGGTGEYKIVGIGLVIAGIAFGLIPLIIYLRNKQHQMLIPAAFGLALLAIGVWALSYRRSITFDSASSTLHLSSGGIFVKSQEAIPFSRLLEIRIRKRLYSSATSQVARYMFYMELQFDDNRTIKVEDDDFNDTEEQARTRAIMLADFCGTIVSHKPARL